MRKRKAKGRKNPAGTANPQTPKTPGPPEPPKPPEQKDVGLKLCPMSIGPCSGPECRFWISPDATENGECIVLLAGLRLLAGNDREFQEVCRRLVRVVALEGGKGLATMLKSVFGDMLSKMFSGFSAPDSAPAESSAPSGDSVLRGLEGED